MFYSDIEIGGTYYLKKRIIQPATGDHPAFIMGEKNDSVLVTASHRDNNSKTSLTVEGVETNKGKEWVCYPNELSRMKTIYFFLLHRIAFKCFRSLKHRYNRKSRLRHKPKNARRKQRRPKITTRPQNNRRNHRGYSWADIQHLINTVEQLTNKLKVTRKLPETIQPISSGLSAQHLLRNQQKLPR